MYKSLTEHARTRDLYYATSLFIDEASMMVFPHFLALGALITEQGDMMLTGDHRQLAPIVSHDWQNEDRPPVVVYKPYRSAYEVIRDIALPNLPVTRPATAIRVSPLNFTYRLPPPLVDLISRLYRLDNIELQGRDREIGVNGPLQDDDAWRRIWQNNYGLFLVLHSERESQRYNQLEADIVENIIEADNHRNPDSIAIVTPHRAQRRLLSTQLSAHYGMRDSPIGVIDTVERLQGGQRSVVILSAVESDTSYIGSNVAFILDLNRSNVAFSRSQDRLVVICSENLINHIPVDYDQYESTMLWKALRSVCSRQIASTEINGEHIEIYTCEPDEDNRGRL